MDRSATAVVKHRISVEEYDRMVLAGVFQGSRLELIHGEILEMPPISPEHASRVDHLNKRLVTRLGDRAHVRIQGPVHMGRFSEPEPDLLILQPSEDGYRSRHPTADDVLLLIEVAKSSLAFDREVKGGLYRGEAVREYWLVNLVDRVLEVRLRDDPRTVRILHPGETVAPSAFPDLTLSVSEILG